MENKSYRIFGELILVEKLYIKENVLDKTGVFKNIVKILAIGEQLKETSLKVGDKVLVGGFRDQNDETYIYESQILRWEL